MPTKLYHLKDLDIIEDTIEVHFSGERIAERVQNAHNGLQRDMSNSMQDFMPLRVGDLKRLTREKNAEMIGTEYVYAAAGTKYGRFQYHGKVMVGETSGSPYVKKGEKKVVTDRRLRYSQHNAQAEWYEAAKARDGKIWVENAQKALEGR